MPNPEAFADMVVMTVKAALAPVLADVKSLQTQLAGWDARWNDVGALRERVAVVEAKSVPESRHEPVVQPVTDLGPVQERLAAAEARLTVLGELRDRVIAVETKAAAPSPSDPVVHDVRDRVLALESKSLPVFEVPADVLSRLSALEARLTVLGELRDRVIAVETKAAAPVTLEKAVDLAPVEQRLSMLELHHETKVAKLTSLSTAVTDLTKDLGSVRERLVAVEVRPPVPGPTGEPGPPGKDGLNGKDGLAGLSFEGVYQEGQSYEKGQLATWAGSSWHCNNPTTTKPGDGSKDWTLMVKRGRDGKDGRDAMAAAPVVSVGSRG